MTHNDDDSSGELQQLESQLLNKLDEKIQQEEEEELLDRYDKSIRAAEEREATQKNDNDSRATDKVVIAGVQPRKTKVLKEEDTWSDMEDDERPRRIFIDDFDNDDNVPRAVGRIIPGSIEGLEYVRATKLIPRYLSKRLKSRKEIGRHFEKSFRKREGCSMEPVYLMGFHVRLESANPNSWRLVVTGFRKTTDLFLQSWERRFQKGRQHSPEVAAPSPAHY